MPFARLAGHPLVVEEKVDGANAALRFETDGRLLLQSRGHYLTGGRRERHFDLFKRWAHRHAGRLFEVLGDRHVVYGEWLYAKHTIHYDRLPHYFLEFDVLDVETGRFLDTPGRRRLLADLPLVSAAVLAEGSFARLDDLTACVGPSTYQSRGHLDRLRDEAAARSLDVDRVLRQTDPTPAMEGLYVKDETDGSVVGRYKWVRAGFLQAVERGEGHWLDRPIVPNGLAPGVDLFDDPSP